MKSSTYKLLSVMVMIVYLGIIGINLYKIGKLDAKSDILYSKNLTPQQSLLCYGEIK